MAESRSSVVPEHDPEPEVVRETRRDLRGIHPRLLFTEKELPDLRRRYEQDITARNKLEKYVASATVFDEPEFLTDATDAQRQGLWIMPSLALHYAITGEDSSRDKGIAFLEALVELEHWQTGPELDSGMSAGNIMIGTALLYDMLYHELPEELRQRVANKLLYHARAMIHGGHLKKNKGQHYWQNDPANNHRWHRDAGLSLALLAVYEGQPEAQWAVDFLVNELSFVHQWLPEDGANHEGPSYLVFGLPHLVLAMQASDRVLETDYLNHDYFPATASFVMHAMRPGFERFIPYADGGSMGYYLSALYAGATIAKDSAMTVGLDQVRELNPEAFAHGWMDLLWRDGELASSDDDHMPPLIGRYEDLGLTLLRDSWDDDAVAGLFKCGPMGGHVLNRYRESSRPMNYINVAHCDPDANSFVIAIGDQLVAETSRYSKAKRSASHNTILINGKGQFAAGRREGEQWSQPAVGNQSMRDTAKVITWHQRDEKTLVIEGEAAGSYPAIKDERPAIDRFRRLFVWKAGEYILVADDVRAPEPAEISWLVQGPSLKLAEASSDAESFELGAKEATCDASLLSDQAVDVSVVESTADDRGKSLGWRQLQAVTAPTREARFVAVFMPWGGQADMSFEPGDGGGTITVKHGEEIDVWEWHYALDDRSASRLRLK